MVSAPQQASIQLQGMQVEELDSNDLVNMCIQGDKESLQEYMHRVVKLTVLAPGVFESSTIDAIVGGGAEGRQPPGCARQNQTKVPPRVIRSDARILQI
jgi:hypothetical protein